MTGFRKTMQRAWGQFGRRIKKHVCLAEAKKDIDHFTLEIIRTKAKSAEERIAKGRFGKCAKCSSGIEVGTLRKDPAHPYCLKCDGIIDPIRNMIHNRRSELNRDLRSLDKQIKSAVSSYEKLKGVGDVVNPSLDTEVVRRERLQADLQQCEEVLLKMATGQYTGECEDCNEDIDRRRLLAKPFAKRCVHCASEAEKQSGGKRR